MKLAYIDPGTGFVLLNMGGWLFAFFAGVFGFLVVYFKKIKNFIHHHKFIFILLSVVIGMGLFIFGFFFMKNSNTKDALSHKIIILGMDGLSPLILESMMEKGELPNFSMLKSQGAYRRLGTTHPPQSPVAWAAFATGKNPGKTGIFDFILRDPKNYGLKLSLSNFENGKVKKVVQEKHFWDYVSDKKIPVAILGCPLTFPPDEINGKMLSGMGVPDALGTEGTFSFYTSEPLEQQNITGGKVFHVNKARLMHMDLMGPKTRSLSGKIQNAGMAFKVVQKDEKTIYVLFDKHKFELEAGQWSDWKEVAFKLGFMKKMKGIVRFYLVSVEPEFKLYAGPVNFDPRDPFFQISYPQKYSKELASAVGLFHTQGMPIDTWAVNEGRLEEAAMLEQAATVDNEKIKILNHELSGQKEGLLFFYFGSPDTIQHMFWRHRDPKSPAYNKEAAEKFKEIISVWYKKMDHVLGSVLEKTHRDDIVMVLSDHGFGSFRRAVHLNSWLREKGYLTLTDETSSEGKELLSDVNWSKTKAYALGFGAIYINLKSREKEGIVNPGSEVENLKKEIAHTLEQWVDSQYHERIARKVYLKEDIFWGYRSDEAPDIFVGFNEGYRASWQTAMGAAPERLIEDNTKKWAGDHLFDPELVPGIFLINQPLKIEKASIYDIAPTVLKIVGFKDDQIKNLDFDGQSLF